MRVTTYLKEVWKMTKQDLVDKVSQELGRTKNEAYEIIEMVLEVLKESIISEEFVKISGFGNFMVRQKTSRKGRNPQTGETLTISERKVLTFKASKILRESLNPE